MKIERALMLGLALTLGTGLMAAQVQTSSSSTTTTTTEAAPPPPPPPQAETTTTTTTTTAGGPVVVGESKHQYKKDKHAAHEQYEADKAASKADASHKVRKAAEKQADANAAAAKADDPTR